MLNKCIKILLIIIDLCTKKNLKMSYFKSNLSHLHTCMHFKIIPDKFQQLPVYIGFMETRYTVKTQYENPAV